MTEHTLDRTFIRDIQQDSQVQDRSWWWWRFGWIRITGKVHPVACFGIHHSSTQSFLQQVGLANVQWETIQDPT